MKISVITLFPELIETYCTSSIMGRAQQAGVVTIETINPRDFTTDVHHKVDDSPYGGGPGMVMMCKPLLDSYNSLLPLAKPSRVFLTSPWGKPLVQKTAQDLSVLGQIVLICGHYEGVDARLFDLIPELEPFSLGDFVLTGGELAAMTAIDAVVRLLPGALGKDVSSEDESFSNGLLEYPQYTRPQTFEGQSVPDILLSGNHGAIANWRHEQQREITQRYRPDLLDIG